jgi:hypothetical protein
MALAAAGTARPLPFLYLLDLVAQRYGIAPWDLRDAPYEDVLRTIHFMGVEAQARKGHG